MDLETLMFSDLTFLGWKVVMSLTEHLGWERLKSGDVLGSSLVLTAL